MNTIAKILNSNLPLVDQAKAILKLGLDFDLQSCRYNPEKTFNIFCAVLDLLAEIESKLESNS